MAINDLSLDTWDTTSTVRFVYCPSCGGKRTQKLVWNGEEDASPDAWYRYESEGLNELRVDERYDSQTDGNAVLDANDPWRTLRYTVHGPGQLAHEIKETKFTYFGASAEPVSSTTFYYHFDALGNVLGLSDSDGALLETYRMDAFGVDQNGWTQDTFTTRRITGKEYDRDVGLYDFRARWYDPKVGRYFSRDAFTGPGWDPAASAYTFCDSNPVLWVDPTGHNLSAPEPWPGGDNAPPQPTPPRGLNPCVEEWTAIFPFVDVTDTFWSAYFQCMHEKGYTGGPNWAWKVLENVAGVGGGYGLACAYPGNPNQYACVRVFPFKVLLRTAPKIAGPLFALDAILWLDVIECASKGCSACKRGEPWIPPSNGPTPVPAPTPTGTL